MAVGLYEALDLLPEAWAEDIAVDAEGEGCSVSYVEAPSGLCVATVERVREHFAAREDDEDWQRMSPGQQLDEVFPEYGGIGALELLDELGIVSVYTSS